MVNNCGRHYQASAPAVFAKRMLPEVVATRFRPSARIAALLSATPIAVLLLPRRTQMLRTVPRRIDQRVAPGRSTD